MELDVEVSDDESIFTSPDLQQLWEDITSVPGYNHPDVLATTKQQNDHDKDIVNENQSEVDPMQLRLNQKVREIKLLQNRIQEFGDREKGTYVCLHQYFELQSRLH